MVRDIAAPSWVVLDRIMDLDNYPKMVQGVDRLERYAEVDLPDGTQEIRARYDIHALHMKFTYYMLHRSAAHGATRYALSASAPPCNCHAIQLLAAPFSYLPVKTTWASVRACETLCLTEHTGALRRQSDLDDSVGYWYVLPQSNEACRVYYSCDTKLRGWVRAPTLILRQAAHLARRSRARADSAARSQ
eukprot:6191984-Pleurochrysis_carterae.AAC.1